MKWKAQNELSCLQSRRSPGLSYTPIRGSSLILDAFILSSRGLFRISTFYFPASSFKYAALNVFFFFAISSSVG